MIALLADLIGLASSLAFFEDGSSAAMGCVAPWYGCQGHMGL